MNPKARPVDIELVKGIKTRIKNVGNHSLKSANFTNLNCCIIIAPVIIITGAIADSGINDNNGIKKIAAKNNGCIIFRTDNVKFFYYCPSFIFSIFAAK